MKTAAAFTWLATLLVTLVNALPGDAAEKKASRASRADVTADEDEGVETAEEYEGLVRERSHYEHRVVARGRDYVRMLKAGLLPLGGGFDSLTAHAARVERTRRALARDLRTLETVEQRLERFGPAAATPAKAVYAQAKAELLAKSQGAIQAAEERDAAYERAFNSNWNPAHTAVYGASSTPLTHQDVTDGFASVKGRLPFPMRGRNEIVRLDEPALEMTGQSGEAVRAVFPGRVSFVGGYGDQGHAVMVDHGDGFSTLYAGFKRTTVDVGDRVQDGTVLGKVKNENGFAKLYFELRSSQGKVDAAPWFGI